MPLSRRTLLEGTGHLCGLTLLSRFWGGKDEPQELQEPEPGSCPTCDQPNRERPLAFFWRSIHDFKLPDGYGWCISLKLEHYPADDEFWPGRRFATIRSHTALGSIESYRRLDGNNGEREQALLKLWELQRRLTTDLVLREHNDPAAILQAGFSLAYMQDHIRSLQPVAFSIPGRIPEQVIVGPKYFVPTHPSQLRPLQYDL